MTNRLAESASPYLLQHADNPVDWWEWTPEAFDEARRRDVPVLLSVGYAACHWCHVMAHESFEDPAIAGLMNGNFVNIKVDREERPDVDAIYMDATQALTGAGGWPMTVFCTPDGKPFYAGTYFPPTPHPQRPSFPQVLQSVAEAWDERRDDLEEMSEKLLTAVNTAEVLPPGEAPPTEEQLRRAVRLLDRQADPVNGGFGNAPKFPPSMVLEFLLRHAARTDDAPALRIAENTLEAMARGGMYDQLGGGFARYSVDAQWVVPHFEKMLYDNAQLLRVYLHWERQTGSPLAHRVVEETAEWLLRELRTAEGGFASSLDADSPDEHGHSVEGAYYVWTPAQLHKVLGDADGAEAARVWGVTEEGTFEEGASVLQLRADPADPAAYARWRTALFEARAKRAAPGRDDKIVAAWNGLAIAGLAEAGFLHDRQEWLDAAVAAAELLVRVHWDEDAARLARVSRDGKVGRHSGVLEDYADVAEGFLALYATTADATWLAHAGRLLDAVLDRFADDDGVLHDTANDAEALVRRPRDVTDGVTPAGTTGAAGALLTYASYTGSARHREAAVRALGTVALLGERAPRAAGWGLAVAEALVDGPLEVAIVGDPADPATRELWRTAVGSPAAGVAVAVGSPDVPAEVELLRDRPLVEGRPAAYVCRQFTCERPTTDVSKLAASLGGRVPSPS